MCDCSIYSTVNSIEHRMRNGLRNFITKGLVAVSSVAVLSWGAVHLRLLGANVRASWTYDYATQPACSPQRPLGCIDHFEVIDITTQKFIVIATAPNPSAPFGRVDAISTSFKYGPPFGERVIAVVAVAKDSKGARVTSNPYAARANAVIRPRATVSAVLSR